jgi:molybdate transport system ATP-binding protein
LRAQAANFELSAAFSAPARGTTALFGPSGSGKTTILRCIAGLQRASYGRVRLNDHVWQDRAHFTPPHRRPIGYVFQEPSLFAHLNVRANILFGAPRGAHAISFDEIVEWLALAPLLTRAPQHLSGGERQRVAIGRALMAQPRLLLMDEPLSALDAQAKQMILPFIERLRRRLAIPMLYVAHDRAEVERIADHIVLLEGGCVTACGARADIQSDPQSPLARARDAGVLLQVTVAGFDSAFGLARLAARGATFEIPAAAMETGRPLRLRIGAGDVSIALVDEKARSSILNAPLARILEAAPLSEAEMLVRLGLGEDGAGDRLLARVTRKSWVALGLAPGLLARAQVKGAALDQMFDESVIRSNGIT